MRVLVTGAAGFVGSHLTEECLRRGWQVVGIDSFTDYYDTDLKRSNVSTALLDDRFRLVEDDLLTVDLASLVDGVDVVFHQAGQPGVRASWGAGFDDYLSCNVLATQRLLEAVVGRPLQRFVFASSSSVYGATTTFPTTETTLPAPRSPYGVTKLAAEHLVGLYAANHGVPTVALRYFTVYGPRQRPDMATHRLLSCGLSGDTFELYGSGEAVRDFTFVGDVVDANLRAATADDVRGVVANIAGGSSVSMNQLLASAGEVLGAPIRVHRTDVARGDVPKTEASTDVARNRLGWAPATSLVDGLRLQLDEIRARSPA